MTNVELALRKAVYLLHELEEERRWHDKAHEPGGPTKGQIVAMRDIVRLLFYVEPRTQDWFSGLRESFPTGLLVRDTKAIAAFEAWLEGQCD